MHAYIVSGASAEDRQRHIQNLLDLRQVSQFDQITLTSENESLGIEAVRQFQKRLMLKPLASTRSVGLIYEAQRLTIEAQNALLKLLEEPPPHVDLILETASTDILLPTVVSRCQIVRLKPAELKSNHDANIKVKAILDLLDQPIGKRLQIIEEFSKTKITALAWVDDSITALESELHDATSKSAISPDDASLKRDLRNIVHLLRNLLRARKHLAVNVNPRLAIDIIFFE